MASPDAVSTADRPASAEVRVWGVAALAMAVVVLSAVLVGTDRLAPSGGWFWVGCAVIGLLCWSVPRSRSAGRAVLILLAVVFSWTVPFPRSPVEVLDDGRLSGLGRAVLGDGAATTLQCLLAAVSVAAVLLSFGPARPTPRRAPGTGLVRCAGPLYGLAVAVLVVGVCVPASYGLQHLSQSRLVAGAEDSQIVEEPEAGDVSDVRIAGRDGWSRDALLAAQPAGDRVIAIESGPLDRDHRPYAAIVGLRATDGALLWRYRLQTPENQSAVGPAVVDVDSRTVMITYGDALVGVDFDGNVRYRKPLSESVAPSPPPVLVSDTFDEASPSLHLSSVAVFGGNRAGTPA